MVAGVLLWNNRDAVADDFRLWNYTPPTNIAELAKRIDFTAEGQRYFYASHPQVEEKTAFNNACGSIEIHAAVLGCYTHTSIYLYNVSDSRLDGVKEVTAAHETLHAAYDRLSDNEHADVDAMLLRQYDAMANDADFAQRFSVYNSLGQADKLNELHSIFGTEVPSLSSELETYYKQYFNDRSAITAYHSAYQGQFDSLRDQQEALKTKIDGLKSEIESTQAQYERDRNTLDADIQSFNQRADNGGYSNQDQFNRDRAALIARSNTLNQTANTINTKINQYNDAIKQYNELAIQTQDLQNSLDSNAVQSAPTV